MVLNYEPLLAELVRQGIEGVKGYRLKLEQNATSPENLKDLLCEGEAAIMFQGAGFRVVLRDSPDLKLTADGQDIYAEVKHFRWKKSDASDDERLRLAFAAGRLVPFGDTSQWENKQPWEEVFDVASRKSKRLQDGAPNVLVMASSSSHAIDDAIIPTAVSLIDDAAAGNRDLLRINGVMLMSEDFHLGERRNTWFFPTRQQAVPLARGPLERIQGIKYWRRYA